MPSIIRNAKVWNDKPTTHREKYKGDWIEIPSKGFIEMNTEDAYQFRGQFMPVIMDADGGKDPVSFKMIRVEEAPPIDEQKAKAAEMPLCQACRYLATSEEDLERHIDAKHLDELIDPEVATQRRRGRPPKIVA